jgi:HAD superfamily hydrolase (TIGR01509 family)
MKHTELKGVIFDIDGTMIDTERIQSDAFIKVLNHHGIPDTELTQHGTVHNPGELTSDTWERLKAIHKIPVDIETLSAHKRQAAMDELSGELTPMPGLIDLVVDLHNRGIKLALASSAQRDRIDRIVEGLDLSGIFDVIISANDVTNVKPAPDAYQKAVELLGMSTDEVIVLEDAEVGVESARAAGVKVVAIPNEYTKNMNFDGAHLVAMSLSEITYDTLRRIVEKG